MPLRVSRHDYAQEDVPRWARLLDPHLPAVDWAVSPGQPLRREDLFDIYVRTTRTWMENGMSSVALGAINLKAFL